MTTLYLYHSESDSYCTMEETEYAAQLEAGSADLAMCLQISAIDYDARAYTPRTRENMRMVLACSKSKRDCSESVALELYTGSLFKKGKAIAERHGIHIWILSAKYKFIDSSTIIDNYDEKFKKPYNGVFPPNPYHGFYLGGQLYFKHMPKTFQPLVPPNQIGYMLRDLKSLEENPDVVEALIEKQLKL